MTSKFDRIALFASKINRQHIQFALAILALTMLILGAGAPVDSGNGTGH